MKFVAHQDIKLVAFIKEKTNSSLSLRAIKRALEKGVCSVNGKKEHFASRDLFEGDVVELSEDWEGFGEEVAKAKPEVLYEDDFYQIVDKPSGIVSEDKNFSYQLVHRLDKGTSGVLILAKNKAAFEAMKNLFLEKKIKKSYLALVDGALKAPFGKKSSYLNKKGFMEGQTIWGTAKRGFWAETYWQLLEKFENYSLIILDIPTGRTHQIRVHLSENGHSVLGDTQYGKKRPFKRLMLHSLSIEFLHPFLKKKILVYANKIQNWL